MKLQSEPAVHGAREFLLLRNSATMLLLLPLQLPGFATFAGEAAPVVPGRMTYNSVVNQQSYQLCL